MEEERRNRLLPLPKEAPAGAGEEVPAEPPGPRITQKDVREAAGILARYKQGKARLERRVVEDELWWELRHWEAVRRDRPAGTAPEPSSAWLFNTLMNKHADAMDNQPEPVILPREESDREVARTLSAVTPVILEACRYEETASAAWWEKLKHGTACYGVFWNPKKENGLGDVEIRQIDLLNLFWEPGITDLQKSRNLFLADLADTDLLEQAWPEHKGRLGGSVIDLKQYSHDPGADLSGKSLVVDWYYRREGPGGRPVLHYAKFVGDELLYASENDPALAGRGFYDHGRYPVVLDTLFPEKGTPVGFGYIAVGKDPQMYIDKLYGYILDHARTAASPRFWVSSSTAVNEEEFLDPGRKLIHVEGELDDRRISQFVMQPVSSIYVQIAQMKIDELKETTANRDVSNGSAGHGVTAAAAIAALQEAGSKVSRDMIAGSYRAFVRVVELVVELIRQFYDPARVFRITEPNSPDGYVFRSLDNRALANQPLPALWPGQTELRYRRPVFDVRVRAQKKNPFSRMEQNERARELYSLGFFRPENAQAALGALEMMDFEGIDEVRQYVRQGQTLQALTEDLTAALAAAVSRDKPEEGEAGSTPAERDKKGTRRQAGRPAGRTGVFAGGKNLGAGEFTSPEQNQMNPPATSGGALGKQRTEAALRNRTGYADRLVKRTKETGGTAPGRLPGH